LQISLMGTLSTWCLRSKSAFWEGENFRRVRLLMSGAKPRCEYGTGPVCFGRGQYTRTTTAPSHRCDALFDWELENVYEIYPRWRHRYAPGVTRNTEHLFGLRVPARTPVRLNPREHRAYRWLPWQEAADACFSPSNAEAILMLPRWLAGEGAR
jgi:hypothetical protein